MACDKKINLENGWNRYCTGIDILAKIPLLGKAFKDDTFFGLYVGCACKSHDIRYSIEGWASRKLTDAAFKRDIKRLGKAQGKPIAAFFAKHIMWVFVRALGNPPIKKWRCWKTWSSKGVQRYQ